MKKILEDRHFQNILIEIAAQTGESITDINKKAATYLRELYTVHNPTANLFGVQFVQYVLGRGYDKTIDVNPKEIRQLTKIARKHPIAFVMTHKTYIDMMVLALVLVRHGLPIPHIFAGINMDFFGLGQFGRQNGVIFIRRSIKDNLVYKATLRHFIAYLVQQRAHFMWAIEGTRSRTGKLVWPKMGILKYIKEAEDYAQQEVKYVPISIVYDLIPDVKEMTLESRGKQKAPETLKWFVDYIRKMSEQFGKISLRIGEPVDMSSGNVALKLYKNVDGNPRQGQISQLALEIVHQINQITPVTTASLVCTALISKFSLTKRAIESDISDLMQIIETQKPDAMVDRGQQIGQSVQHALNLFLRAGILQQKGDALNAMYLINPDKFLEATYYANMSVHHLYQRAFIELALLKVQYTEATHRTLAFWQEVMDLRKLFKFEFFYSKKEKFTEEIETNLDAIAEDWRNILKDGTSNFVTLLEQQKVLVAPVVLFSYIDAYKVAVQTLMDFDTSQPFNDNRFLDQCLFVGEKMHWQGRIQRLESVSKPFLKNGLRLLKNFDLIVDTEGNKHQPRQQLQLQLDDIAKRIGILQEITMRQPLETSPEVPLERDIVPGSKTESITSDLLKTEQGAHIAAFFDLDKTLIKGFSAKDFFQARLFSGRMTAREITAQFSGVIAFARGGGNFAGLAAIGARGVKGLDEQVFIQVGEEVYYKHLADAIYPEARALVAAHLSMGHTVAIISAATPYQVNPIARDLGIEHVMCTTLEVDNRGKFTGNIVEPACWGEGKAIKGKAFAEEHHIDLSKSYFYTDSASDLPLLELVGNPRPLNPNTKLAALAFKNGWPVYRFNDDNRTNVMDFARTGMAFSSLIPAAVTGIFDGAMNLSWRDGVNTMMATVGDLVISFSGIELVVKGEHNLWAQRPAVFMFNHQSSVDLFIAAKLIRKDAVGIAKKELQNMPLIGQMMAAAGVIFIDRKNRAQAIEAMKPAITALHNGTSIIIFPEGTRSKGYNLGKFKKGGFHLAIAAGVPIVPVVVRNAYDAMPKGATFLKSTAIEVVVHPAMPTEGWGKDNLEDNMRKVRQIFLDELGQVEVEIKEKVY